MYKLNTAVFEHKLNDYTWKSLSLNTYNLSLCYAYSNQSCKPTILISSAKKRAIYDQFGEEGLKGGVPEKGSLFNVHNFYRISMSVIGIAK